MTGKADYAYSDETDYDHLADVLEQLADTLRGERSDAAITTTEAKTRSEPDNFGTVRLSVEYIPDKDDDALLRPIRFDDGEN